MKSLRSVEHVPYVSAQKASAQQGARFQVSYVHAEWPPCAGRPSSSRPQAADCLIESLSSGWQGCTRSIHMDRIHIVETARPQRLCLWPGFSFSSGQISVRFLRSSDPEGNKSTGRSTNQDIVMASILAVLDSINKLLLIKRSNI